MQSRSTGSLQRSRDDKSDETNFSDLRREILGTFGGSDEHGTKGGFGGFAASCEREIADQTETVASFLGFFRPRTGLMQGLRGLCAIGRLLIPLHVQGDTLANVFSRPH